MAYDDHPAYDAAPWGFTNVEQAFASLYQPEVA